MWKLSGIIKTKNCTFNSSMYVTRKNAKYNEETDTIKYILKKTYHFNAKETGCRSLDDEVTVLNAALVVTLRCYIISISFL